MMIACLYIYASAYGPRYGVILNMYCSSIPKDLLVPPFFSCRPKAWGLIYLTKHHLILPLLIPAPIMQAFYWIHCAMENCDESCVWIGCDTNVQCYVSQLASQCIYDNLAKNNVYTTIMQMPFCRTHQTIVQVVQEIHVFVHNNTGLVNGWCVSINRMIKVFPGPPLHVCYVYV